MKYKSTVHNSREVQIPRDKKPEPKKMQIEVRAEVQEEAVPSIIDQTNVVVHLDRDPNDPRNRPETKALPSLDD